MEPIVFLTHEEICQLTGARTKAGQVRALKQNGIKHTIKMNGWPCVISANLLPAKGRLAEETPKWTPRKAR
ncbi:MULTISPECIES: DUF4224 domain-containing protein [Pseudomonas]|uniref:DUF4224 domain-containing protein n=1 Tax=Pseudomonas nitroreducens TaxID=46680 RepID=UPI001E54CA60|nr:MULTISPECIES: DUF4224 domain-containing protein [Pseudomonas]MCE4073270.1 DUF4224 domain-containing protein [Pseudomonas nitritireducens]MCE4082573.1 DUF4224 domain-containing protein [Pseudomonas nitroreducens]